MSTLRATYRNGVWRISLRHEDGAAPYDRARLATAMERGRTHLRNFREHLGQDSGVWQLEYPKAAIGEGEMALGNADLLAEACAAGAAAAVEVEAPGPWLNVRSTQHAFRTRGLPVSGQRASALLDRGLFVVSALLAAIWLLAGMLRSGREGDRLPARAESLFAVHGEWTNRTRHLLSLLGDGAAPAAVIVLGRPRVALRELCKQWESELGLRLPPLRRPLSISAAFRAIPDAFALLRLGYSRLSQCYYLPPFREQVAIAYRVIFGAISAAWWREQRLSPHKVYYGHTGVADTTGLELAQQKSGAETVHVVHGISSGMNFTGRSSTALFRCGHDAGWHTRLGGYERCLAEVAERPAYRRGPEGLLLLTNLAHPMNPWFRVTGIEDEARVLHDVAEAARERLGDRIPMLWKPHPATYRLPSAPQEALNKQASALGYRRVAARGDVGDLAHQNRWLLCTVSTVVVDLLACGYLPIMLEWQTVDPDPSLAQYPVRARNREELANMIERLRDDQSCEALFQEAWSAIQPCGPLHARHL